MQHFIQPVFYHDYNCQGKNGVYIGASLKRGCLPIDTVGISFSSLYFVNASVKHIRLFSIKTVLTQLFKKYLNLKNTWASQLHT